MLQPDCLHQFKALSASLQQQQQQSLLLHLFLPLALHI